MIEEVERLISYKFSNPELIKEALTHPSYAHECGSEKHNERLEFLGDAVIGLIVTEYLLKKYPEKREGELAVIKSKLVSRGALSHLARKIGVGPFLLISEGDERQGMRERDSTLANLIEAIVGAMYLDKGLESVKGFLLPWLDFLMQELGLSKVIKKDPKTELQEILQSKYRELPKYELLSIEGPSHKPIFRVRLLFRGRVLSVGVGRSRKEAEKHAAEKALDLLYREDIGCYNNKKASISLEGSGNGC